MPRKRCLEGVSESRRAKRLATTQTAGQRQPLIGHCSQDATNMSSESRYGQTSYPSEEKQKCFDFSKNGTIMPVLVIKKEIIEPSEQNQELILPDYPQHMTSIDPMSVVETEIQDSSEKNQKFLLTNVKVEPTEFENTVDEPSRTEESSESIISENSITLKYKLTRCSVLLRDCLIPENFAALSSNFKFLKINKDISNAYPKDHLYPLGESPFFSHISDTYKNIVSCKEEQKTKSCKVGRFIGRKKKRVRSKKVKLIEQKPKTLKVVRIKEIKKKKVYSRKVKIDPKYICNCYNTITMGSPLDENNSESAQQLCSCVTNDFMLSENRKPEEISLFDPDFGKITCNINKIY